MITTNDRDSEGSQTSNSDREDMDPSLIDTDNEAGSGTRTTPSTTQPSTTRTRRPRYRFDNDGTCRRNELLLQQVLALSPFMAPHGGALRLWEQIADHCNSVQDLRVSNPKDPILTAHNARVHFKDLMTRYGKEGVVAGPHEEPSDSYQKILADVYHQVKSKLHIAILIHLLIYQWKSVQSMKSEKQMVLGKRTPGQRMDDIGSRAKQRQIASNPHTNDRPIIPAGTRDEGKPVMQPHPIQPHPIQPHPPANIHHPHLHPRANVRIAPEPQHIQPAPPSHSQPHPIRIRQALSPPGVPGRQSQGERVMRNRPIEAAQPRVGGPSLALPAKTVPLPPPQTSRQPSSTPPAIAPAPVPAPKPAQAPKPASASASAPAPAPPTIAPAPPAQAPPAPAQAIAPHAPSVVATTTEAQTARSSVSPTALGQAAHTCAPVSGRTERELLEAILNQLQQSEERRTKRAEEAARRSKELDQLEASREAQRKEDADGRERRFQELMVHMQQSTLAVLSRLAELQTQFSQR
ncbi:hypothetical protein CLU79DRAFT_752278 [Phycomyces nitens]|nr:hypothetical protein CLU79DRAFT_752278 [Phycomyces nitens]